MLKATKISSLPLYCPGWSGWRHGTGGHVPVLLDPVLPSRIPALWLRKPTLLSSILQRPSEQVRNQTSCLQGWPRCQNMCFAGEARREKSWCPVRSSQSVDSFYDFYRQIRNLMAAWLVPPATWSSLRTLKTTWRFQFCYFWICSNILMSNSKKIYSTSKCAGVSNHNKTESGAAEGVGLVDMG